MKRGFTLVELAIVLVIIGLIIAGILVARSMMETAQITSFVKEMQSYDVAVSNFKTRYNQLPGDSNLFSPGGDNDGTIGQIAFWSGWTTEPGNFWVHLNLNGFQPDKTYVSAVTGSLSHTGSTRNVPSTAISADGGVAVSTNTAMSYHIPWSPAHAYIIGNFSTTTAYNSNPASRLAGNCNFQACGIITRYVAKAVDSKMDDGNVSTGSVRANDPWGNTFCTASTQCTSAGGVDCLCPLYIQLLGQSEGN